MIRFRLQNFDESRIHSLHLRNFKCFEDQSITFKPLTLLTGLNSAGKSSVLQALLLLRQSYQQGLLDTTGLALNGDLTNVGTAGDALFEGANEEIIGFDLILSEKCTMSWKWQYELGNDAEEAESDVMKLILRDGDSNLYARSNLFTDDFHYLQAERLGPRDLSEMSDFQVRQHRQIGSGGQYAAHFLSLFGNDTITNSNLNHPAAKTLTLKEQVNAWLGEISPGTNLLLTRHPGTSFMSLRYSYLTGKQFSQAYRPQNVGFGVTYVLPVLIAILASSTGSLLLIENPEAHLHPKGQVQMGGLLARAASCGIQIIIETHSDHILNGIRLAVHDGKLSPDDVQLHFLQRNTQDGVAQVTSPHMDRDGRIDQWPDDFFDEWEKSLVALLEPRGN